jgi:hypothetical protein
MTISSLVAWLLLVLACATTHQEVFGADSWGQARQPRWGDEPDYLRGYETLPAVQDRDPRYPDAYRADDLRRDPNGGWSGTGYGGYDVAPAQGREPGGFVDRDGRWMEYPLEPTERYRDAPYDNEPGRYSPSPWAAQPESPVESGDSGVRGGWHDTNPGPAYRSEVPGPAIPQPEYRFRGDPQLSSGRWSGSDGTQGYRFRPLTDREAGQGSQTPGWRPLEPGRGERGGRTSAPAGLMDALTPPPRTFGFEPGAWP